MELLSIRIKSVLFSFSFERAGPLRKGETFGHRRTSAAMSMSVHLGGEGAVGPPLAMARVKEKEKQREEKDRAEKGRAEETLSFLLILT